MKFKYRQNLCVWTVCMSHRSSTRFLNLHRITMLTFIVSVLHPWDWAVSNALKIKEVRCSPQILCSISFLWHHCLNLLSLQPTSQCVLYAKQLVFKVKNLCVLDCGYSHITDTTISHKKNNVKPSCTAEDHLRWN